MIDLAEEWRKLDLERRKPDSRNHWDERAKTFSFKDIPDAYLRSFISKAEIAGDERILDMGCGTGSLAIALANKGCSVVAADFSEGMLARLRTNASESGVLFDEFDSKKTTFTKENSLKQKNTCCFLPPKGKVFPLSLSWEDNWESFGLRENMVDVAVASRSLITHDLKDSLRKLSWTAQRRVCVTVGTGVSPRVDMRVARAMGLTLERHNDALFVFGIASDLGYEPTVSYIHSPRIKTYVSPDEAYYSLLKTKDYIADAAEQISEKECENNLRIFLDKHLVEFEENGTKLWTLDEPRIVPWAFISWDTGIAS